ncbi:unnamed protein product, partial [Urochloa humidicola]
VSLILYQFLAIQELVHLVNIFRSSVGPGGYFVGRPTNNSEKKDEPVAAGEQKATTENTTGASC